MSKEFFMALGFTLADLTPITTSVGTAQEGQSLAVLGRSRRPMYLQLNGIPTKFKTYPVIIDRLSMPFNIGAEFLTKHGIDQLHSKNLLRLQGRHVPLIASINLPSFEKLNLTAYTDESIVVPPMSQSLVKLTVPDVTKGLAPHGHGFLSGSISFMNKTDLHPVLDTFVDCTAQGQILASVLNTTPDPICLKKNVSYGDFRLARSYHDDHLSSPHPWRVLALTPDEGGQSGSNSSKKSNPPFSQNANGPTQQDHKTDAPTSDSKSDKASKETKQKKPTQKELDQIIDRFKLNKSPFLSDSRQRYRAAMVLFNNRDAFSFDGSFGKTKLIKHRIQTEPSHKPINQKYRPVNPALEKDLKEQIKQWQEHGVIEKSNSPWNFGLVAAPKKNGKIRWCVDYRALNQITTKDSHPIGNIDDNLSRLSRSTIFSCIDGSGAYHVVELDEADKEKTAFGTPWGSYQFTHMPFGLCNAPSTYARLVQMVLQGIPYHVALPYLDDTIIHSKSLDEHLVSLDRVLRANISAGLKLSPEKCSFFCDEVSYLGHVVSAKGIFPNPDYVKIVAKWPTPNTRAKVRTFLGKTGYYRRFIKDYSKIAGPLIDKLAKTELDDKTEFPVTPEFEKSFTQLKHALTKAPILAYPQFDSDEPFILDTDWSAENNAVGAVLSQKQDGKERVICYGAKRLNKAQAAYSPTKGELAGVIIFMQKWKYFLQHRHFLLRTDHRALCWIRSMVEPTGMIQRWLDILAGFDFRVEHRPGPKHGNADSLSRALHLSPASSEVDISQGERIATVVPASLDAATILTEQQADPDLNFLIEALQANDAPSKAQLASSSRLGKLYGGLFSNLSLNDKGHLVYSVQSSSSGVSTTRQLILLPRNLWSAAIWAAHEASAHMAAQATTDRALKHFYFAGMLAFTSTLLRTCKQCQTKVGNSKDQRALLRPSLSGYPFQKLSLDFVGPLPTSSKGNAYILTVLDTFTRWLEAFPLRAATADRVVKILIKEIFSRYGLCEQLHSDRGSQFTGDLLSDVAQSLGISHTQTPAYNPKSNPVERQHRTLQQALTALVNEHPKRWEQMLPHALFAMRTTISRSTGFAPFQLMFGRDATSNLDFVFGPPKSADTPLTEYATQLSSDVLQAHHWARQNIGRSISRQRRAYHADAKTFTIGQQVWLFTPRLRPGQSKKFATYWTGPWTISKQLNDLMFEIKPDSSWLRKNPETVSIDRLKPFFADELDKRLHCPPSATADLTMAGDEYAEHLLDPRDDDEFDQGFDVFLPLPVPQPLPPPAADMGPPPLAPPPPPPAPPAPPPPGPPPPAPPPPPPPPAPPLLARPVSPARSRSTSPVLAPPRSRSPSPYRTPQYAHPLARRHLPDTPATPFDLQLTPDTPRARARPTPTERERLRLRTEREDREARRQQQADARRLRYAHRSGRQLPPPDDPCNTS